MKGFVHPLLQGDDRVIEGYRIATEHEFGTMQHAASQHPELVERWQLLLTMCRQALTGTWTFPEDRSDEDSRFAYQLRSKLLGLSAGTSKFALDASLYGYYSSAFAMTRHMLECWFWSAHVGFQPADARAWFWQRAAEVNDRQLLFERDSERIISAVVSRFRKDFGAEAYIADRSDTVRKAMHKGAHASGHLLTQMSTDAQDRFVIGANYRPELAIVALTCGIWATIVILLEINNIRPQSSAWQQALVDIKAIHRTAIPDFSSEPWTDGDDENTRE